MYLRDYVIRKKFTRKSKLGKEHTYYRNARMLIFRCDNCSSLFERPKGNMDPKRVSNNVFHVCPDCDSKRFAQRKGVEWKRVWTLDASSDMDISKI